VIPLGVLASNQLKVSLVHLHYNVLEERREVVQCCGVDIIGINMHAMHVLSVLHDNDDRLT
jgi:hypothetical protein